MTEAKNLKSLVKQYADAKKELDKKVTKAIETENQRRQAQKESLTRPD